MENASYIAMSRQTALWRQMETVANNMANANTPAYKGEQMMFTDYLVRVKSPDRSMGDKVAFVQDIGLLRDTGEGAMTTTGNSLDFAMSGDGYFVIDTPEGPRYTRNGHFRLDQSGMLVTEDGAAVMQTGNQPIIFAPNESTISVAGDGTISTENGAVGRFRVVRFDNQQQLQKAGASLYDTVAEPLDVPRAQVVQGMLEESNVKPVVEMSKMIAIVRDYQGVQKMLDNEHERQLRAIQVLGQKQA